MTVAAILEAMADRGAIEQLFHDVKEVWGAGQQQVRNVYASIGAFTVNLVLYSVVEAWAWASWRRGSWWTEAVRRGMRRCVVRRMRISGRRCKGRSCGKEIQAALRERPKREEFQALAMRLLHLAA